MKQVEIEKIIKKRAERLEKLEKLNQTCAEIFKLNQLKIKMESKL
jgi:hypothetical protein